MENLINSYIKSNSFIDEIKIENIVSKGNLTKTMENVKFFKPDTIFPSKKLASLISFYQRMEKGNLIQKIKKPKCRDIVSKSNINYVHARIDYPLSNRATIQFKCNTKITYGILLYLYTIAYQLVYKIEDLDVGCPTENNSGTFNRQTSDGRYGIWVMVFAI